MHLDHIRVGLERGMKIFAEKPVVTTEAETMELARLIGEYGADRVMVGLVLRYAPLYVDLRKAQKDGLLGDVASIEASEHIPPYHGAFFMRDWRRYDRYAGGFLLEKCCHDLDLYNGVMGCRPDARRQLRRAAAPSHQRTLRNARASTTSRSITASRAAGWAPTRSSTAMATSSISRPPSSNTPTARR